MATVTWMGCSLRLQWPEHQVTVRLETSGIAEDASLVTDSGDEVRPERLAVTIWSIELERCNASPPGLPTANVFDIVREATSMSTAYAHAERAPNRIWRSRVVLLNHESDQTLVMGKMTPPPGDYCRIRVLLQAADDDSLQLEDAPSMMGVSASAAGVWRSSGDAEFGEFDWTSSRTVERIFNLDQPLELGEEDAVDTQITVRIHALDWFDAVDLDDGRDAAVSRFLGNVRQSISLEEAP